jgi:hypothetical protein
MDDGAGVADAVLERLHHAAPMYNNGRNHAEVH